MKKNISINIGGIIFHIEEDGYEKLRSYLDSINKYFSSFEDNKEIVEDIESRIAEIFLSKLSDGKQVIYLIDIEELIGIMGTTEDFDATIGEEPEGQKETTFTEEKEAQDSKESEEPERSQSKRLRRDTKRKVFGGVASGIAHYFGLDPIWIRLLILGLFVNVLFGGLSGAVFIGYIILWIVLPSSDELEDDVKIKKLFRSSKGRVLGGVSSGLSSYFGTDVAVIRLLFVLSIFLGGAGIILYLILWIITPEAKTITQKMQMEGEPVTISNIEENVKKSLNVNEGEESALAKILLFPFRIIAIIISGLSKMLGPLATAFIEIIRIFTGAIVVIVGFALMLAFIITFLVLLGWSSSFWMDHIQFGDFPIELAMDSFSGYALLSAFLIAFIPALGITLMGLVIILKRRVGNSYLGWTLFGLWILGLLGASFFFPSMIRDFRVEGDIRETKEFPITTGTPFLRLNEIDLVRYEGVDLRLRGHEDSTYRLDTRIESRGATRSRAKENASLVSYTVLQNGNDFLFDSNLEFPEGAQFRFQEADVTFFIPEGKVFRMESDLREILSNTLYLNGYRPYQMENNDWVFDETGLQCLTCEKRSSRRRDRSNRTRDRSSRRSSKNYSLGREWRKVDGTTVKYEYEDFNEIKISSYLKVFIEEDDEYEITLKGDEDDLEDIYINQRSGTLEVKHRDYDWGWWEEKAWTRDVAIYIKMPKLEALELLGACKANVSGFNNRDMDFTLTGASEVNASISPDYLNIDIKGASEINLEGNARKIRADVAGASKLEALDFKTDYAELDVKGASKARLYVNEELSVSSSGISSVTYKGNARVSADENGLSTIKRYR